MNTHSSVADGRMETLAAWGGACGAGPELIREILESVTVDQGLKLLETVPGLREKVMEQGGKTGLGASDIAGRRVHEGRMYPVYQ